MILKSQNGRSMLEMLGVLAIIGILSVVMLWSYEMAMTRYRASEVIQETNQIALNVQEQFESNIQEVNLAFFIPGGGDSLKIAGYDALFEKGKAANTFEITIQDVNKDVCERLLDCGWSGPYAIMVNGGFNGPCSENNRVTAAYNDSLSACNGYLTPSHECGDDGCAKGFYRDTQLNTCKSCDTLSKNATNELSSMDLNNDSCTKCPGFVITAYNSGNNMACIYCPAPRVPCGRTCCPEGQVCIDATPGTCSVPGCTTDADCTNPSKPLCNALTQQCVSGCRTNSQCAAGRYCRLKATMGANNCFRTPDVGTCEATSPYTFGRYKRSGGYAFWFGIQEFCSALGNYRPATYRDICGSNNVGAHTLTLANCPNLASIPNFNEDVWLADPRPTSCYAYKLQKGSAVTALHYVGTTRFVLCVPK